MASAALGQASPPALLGQARRGEPLPSARLHLRLCLQPSPPPGLHPRHGASTAGAPLRLLVLRVVDHLLVHPVGRLGDRRVLRGREGVFREGWAWR